ncbi:MAG: hypothetical protein ACTSU9_14325 [Promethearchaeota archaeon]
MTTNNNCDEYQTRFKELIQENDAYINIVTHNDPDGLVAAAITIKGLLEMGFDDIGIFFEGPSTIQKGRSFLLDEKSDNYVDGFIILLDLPYHENAHVWIDHHEGGISPSARTRFIYHDKEHSAATLTHIFFTTRLGLNGPLINLKFLQYVDARDTGKPPEVQKNAAIDFEAFSMAVYDDRNDYNFLIDLIRRVVENESMKDVVNDSRIRIKVKHQKKRRNRGLRHLDNMLVAETPDEFLKLVDVESDKAPDDPGKRRFFYFKKFLCYDESDIITQELDVKYGAAIPYFVLVPEAEKREIDYNYLLVFRGDHKKDIIHCTISLNQSKEIDGVQDVSKFARKMGGGGHKYAAGFVIPLDKFMHTLEACVDYFSGD